MYQQYIYIYIYNAIIAKFEKTFRIPFSEGLTSIPQRMEKGKKNFGQKS